MDERNFFFAGGGTGGHIYPALAVAERIAELAPSASVHFFCSSRSIDSAILAPTGFDYTALPAAGFSLRPGSIVRSVRAFTKSCRIAKAAIARSKNPVVIGAGGFIAGPVCLAAHKLKVPIAVLNVDIVPGRANRIIARWANEIFLQFEDTATHFRRTSAKLTVLGCPLRKAFDDPQPQQILRTLNLNRQKKLLLITGASSGSASINDAVCSLLGKLDAFAGNWQIVHLTGHANFDKVNRRYADAKIAHKVLAYCDDMPSLLAAAGLVVGRSGAVSVAEYAAAFVPSICMPYPHHKDRHQYLNAAKLVEADAAVIVDDLPDPTDRAEWLWEQLAELMADDDRREEMTENCANIATPDAALNIARKLTESPSTEA
ncbi:MAG: UDP-N-acetylglucosamine--N-acetylmuramyl-(pentapeptide) pyrophosphoryl-undecaprenol N-acetylglucosamine transferase [Sedimentisphaerales bacterium]|nr:UDP-N-acetylglucosamine--N-acetylmuramyl-(pentapeptide) pyrophosphoryl-undecaprenol N-acetylglucosamine transferase [Sedimentisphaerales bacterium]